MAPLAQQFAGAQMYTYVVQEHEIGPEEWRRRNQYGGPALEIDGTEWRNETAFINCVFGSNLRPDLRPQARRQEAAAGRPCLTGVAAAASKGIPCRCSCLPAR